MIKGEPGGRYIQAYVPDGLYKKLKVKSVMESRNLSDVIHDMILLGLASLTNPTNKRRTKL